MTIALEPYPTFTYWVVYWRKPRGTVWRLWCDLWWSRKTHKMRRLRPLLLNTRRAARIAAARVRRADALKQTPLRHTRVRKLPVRIPEKP